jgi:hypothetical protein
MTAEMVSRMPENPAQRGRHRTRTGQRRGRPRGASVFVCSGTPTGRPPRHARIVPPHPVIGYHRLEGMARTVTHMFVVAAVSAAVLLVGDLATPDRPAPAQVVEWVGR